MTKSHRSKIAFCLGLAVVLAVAGFLIYSRRRSNPQTTTIDLKQDVKPPFRFVAYGDTRFHDPSDTLDANPIARMALVQAISDANPAFICFSGDVVFNGYDKKDWDVWESETAVWRQKSIPIYPALGNHEFHGDLKIAMGNYFGHFPALKDSHYYSVRAGNTLLLVLDSSQAEVVGPQGEWLLKKLDHVPSDVDFVFLMLHHPPYTSSSEVGVHAGGHAVRPAEKALAKVLEERQAQASFRIVVLSGHVHNYERHEHGGVTYFVSGGGGAHAYPIDRGPNDLYKSNEVNYHFLLVDVEQKQATITMNRVDFASGKPVWTQPDSVKVAVPQAAVGAATGQ